MGVQSIKVRKAKSLAYSGEGNPNYGKRGRRNGKSRPVIQLTIQGEIVKIWPSFYDASLQYGTGVSKALLGKNYNNYSNGFRWYYMKDFTIWFLFKHVLAKLFRVTTNVVKKKENKVHKETPQNVKKTTYQKFEVDQYSFEGKFIKRWSSSLEITKQLGIPSSSISRNIHGHIEHAGGYKFRKVIQDDEDDN